MNSQILRVGRSPAHDIEVRELPNDIGISVGSHRLFWDEAIKLRDWLQLAIQERTERLHSSANGESACTHPYENLTGVRQDDTLTQIKCKCGAALPDRPVNPIAANKY